MGSKYTVKEFADKFALTEEYVRQACRGQTIGSSNYTASLQPGWRSYKSGKRWFIVRDDDDFDESDSWKDNSIGLQFSETACIDALVTHWHRQGILRSKELHRSEPEPLDPKIVLGLGNAYVEAVESGQIECNLRFGRDGSCKVSFSGAKPLLRMIVLEMFLREDSKKLRELQSHFLTAWDNEFEDAKQRKPRRKRSIYGGLQPSKATRVEFDRRCLNCGQRHSRKAGSRFCNDKCADAHRKWIQRLPKEPGERLKMMRKRLTKVLANLYSAPGHF